MPTDFVTGLEVLLSQRRLSGPRLHGKKIPAVCLDWPVTCSIEGNGHGCRGALGDGDRQALFSSVVQSNVQREGAG